MLHAFANGVPPRSNSTSALFQTGLPGLNPKRPLAGARVREAIRVYVDVDTYNDAGYVKVTYARTIIIEFQLHNIVQRTEILVSTTIPKMSALEAKKRNLSLNTLPKEGPIKIETSGKRGSIPLPTTTKTVSREEAGLDLAVLNSYVAKVVAYRESPEYDSDPNHRPLPTRQVEAMNNDMATATAAGTVPFTLGTGAKPGIGGAKATAGAGGLGEAMGTTLFPKQFARSKVLSRWAATKLSRILGRTIPAGDVIGKLTGWLGAAGLPVKQWALGADYLKPGEQRLYVYTDFKMGGQSIYNRDVSPEWVHTGQRWLYNSVLGPIEFILKRVL